MSKMPFNRRSFVRLSAAAIGIAAVEPLYAGQAGNGGSLLAEARKYNEGNGVVLDYRKAAALFQNAASAGSVEASAWLGKMYVHGRGVAKDQTKGAGMISAAAGQGDPVGLRLMGLLYQKGLAVTRDYGKARQFYEQAAAKGDAIANGRLGMLYLFGRGVPKDLTKAKQYLNQGAGLGDPWSMVELGMLYKRDHTKSDRNLAFTQFTQAAATGNRVGAYRLASAYHYGIGTKKDPAAAAKYLWQAASKGHPKAQAAVASLYAKGGIVGRDLEQAYALYTLSSRQGIRRATITLRALEKQMTVQQIDNAKALADNYQAQNPQSRWS
jgi:TPR repeat protein